MLEEKLDGLVNLLKSKQDSEKSTPAITPRLSLAETSTSTFSPQYTPTDPINADAEVWEDRLYHGGSMQQRFDLPPEEITHLKKSVMMTCKEPIPYTSTDISLDPENADNLLHIYRTEMKSSLPFICIPDHLTAEELRRTCPMLFLSVMAVTTRITSQQTSISTLLMKVLSERVILGVERNLDLLFATLNYAGWHVDSSSRTSAADEIPGHTITFSTTANLRPCSLWLRP